MLDDQNRMLNYENTVWLFKLNFILYNLVCFQKIKRLVSLLSISGNCAMMCSRDTPASLTPISVSSASPGATKVTGPSMFGGDWANIKLEGGVVALNVLLRYDPALCVSILTVFSLGDTRCSLLVYLVTCPSNRFNPENQNKFCKKQTSW